MITINLLPEEYRRTARTPIRMMVALATAVAVNASLLAWWCWMSFGVAAKVETERSVLQLEMDGLTPQVTYHSALKKEVAFHSSRESTLAQITSTRVEWARVLDDLIDVVHAGGEGVAHYIWFDDVNVMQTAPRPGARRGSGQSYGSLKCSGHSGSPEWDQVPAFLKDIGDTSLTDLMGSFFSPAAPEGDLDDAERDLIPAVNWSFPLTLDLRAPADREVGGMKRPEGR